jgi:hypothetical protein
MPPDSSRTSLQPTLTDTLTDTEAPAVRTTVHEIIVGDARLRVERDRASGAHIYFVNGRPCNVNAYLAVTQEHLDRRGPVSP